MPQEQCYMCDEAASSVEHAPPKCLSPEIKNSEIDLRINLVTAPSCEEHNCKKNMMMNS